MRDVTFRRTVNGKSYDTIEADDFFLMLNEIGITPKIFHLKNLRNYLAVDKDNNEVLLLENIQATV